MSKLLSIMAVIIVTCSMTPVTASPASDARQGIEKAIATRTLAREHKDVNAYMQTFTPDWVLVSVSGQSTDCKTLKASWTKYYAHNPPSKATDFQVEFKSVTAHGTVANASLLTHFEYPVVHKPTGTEYVYRITRSDSVWVKSVGQWQERHEHIVLDDLIYSVTPVNDPFNPWGNSAGIQRPGH